MPSPESERRYKAAEEIRQQRAMQRDRQGWLTTVAADLGERYSPARATLDKIEFYHADQRPVVNRLRDLIPRLPEFIQAGRGMLFYGTVGTGKDHLLAAMLYAAAAAGFRCRWTDGFEFFASFRDAIHHERSEAEIFRRLAEPEVLGISDPIPSVADPRYSLGQLKRLLDRRNRAMRCTWVTLNALNPQDADGKLSSPVFDRMRDDAELFRCFWPSFRERKR